MYLPPQNIASHSQGTSDLMIPVVSSPSNCIEQNSAQIDTVLDTYFHDIVLTVDPTELGATFGFA